MSRCPSTILYILHAAILVCSCVLFLFPSSCCISVYSQFAVFFAVDGQACNELKHKTGEIERRPLSSFELFHIGHKSGSLRRHVLYGHSEAQSRKPEDLGGIGIPYTSNLHFCNSRFQNLHFFQVQKPTSKDHVNLPFSCTLLPHKASHGQNGFGICSMVQRTDLEYQLVPITTDTSLRGWK